MQIMRIELNIRHPDKSRAEAFLGSLKDQFEQIPFDWKSLEESNRIIDAIKLSNTNKTLTITLLFLGRYADASIIAKANSIQIPARWSCNGSMMYVVESADLKKVNDVLGTFAGRE
jgi:hypothetical protein